MNANNYKIQKYVLELSLKEIQALNKLFDTTQDKDLERVGYIVKTILYRNDPCTLLSTKHTYPTKE